MTESRLEHIEKRFDSLCDNGYSYEDMADFAVDVIGELLDYIQELETKLKEKH